jgi:hypothetical protein
MACERTKRKNTERGGDFFGESGPFGATIFIKWVTDIIGIIPAEHRETLKPAREVRFA